MTFEVVFTPDADDDVAGACAWYEAQEPGLGEQFLACLEMCILGIQRQPLAHPIVMDVFRRALVSRFPFVVFYEVTVDILVVHSVFHCSQQPLKWRRRLAGRRGE